MDKLVSIVLPVYNGERFLAQSIESVLNQTYKNLELIIVNDCSTDSSEDIILKYQAIDERIKYYKNEVNLKLPRSLNKGFSFAKGEFYTWTSDDNYYDLTAIEKMVEYLNNNPKTDMVCCDYIMLFDTKNEEKYFSVLKGNLLCGNNIGACFLYRSSIAKKVGEYNPDLFLVEDYDYWVRIFLQGSIDALHETLYYYRMHEKSLSKSREKEIDDLDQKYKLSMLPKYEKAKLSKYILYGYFDSMLSSCDNPKEKFKLFYRISIKHPIYGLKKTIKKIFRRNKSEFSR